MAEPGMTLQGRYQVLQRLNQGGMAVVYLANDTRLGQRQVVLKRMNPQALAPEERGWAEANFRQEANILARLDHPGLASVTDFFEEEGFLYLVMEYVQGETLGAVLARTYRVDEQQATVWGQELSAVLAYLHRQVPPIVFRDLKPDNIMVQPDGALKLIDFGIARFFKPGQSTDTVALGTIGYAPPEQYGRGQTDPRADVYSLGVVLYQLLTGYDPARTPMNLPPLRELAPATSPRLAAAIEQALARDPAHRFADAAAFAQALRPTVPTPLPPPRRSRQPLLAGGATLVLVALALLWALARREPGSELVAPQTAGLGAADSAAPTAAPDSLPVEAAALAAALETEPATAPVTPAMTATPAPSATVTPPPTATATALPPARTGPSQPAQYGELESQYLAALARYRPAPPLMFAYKGAAPTIDGLLDEWATTAYPVAAVVHDAGYWSGPDDLSASAHVAWDDTNLYLAVSVVDDRFVQESSGIMLYQGDSAEVWFDTDLNGDFENSEMSADDHHIGFSPGRPSELVTESYRWSPAGHQGPVGGHIAAARTGQGYTLEWALPWAAVGAIPTDGAAFGFTLCLSDNDRDGVQIQESMVCIHGSRRHNQPQSWSTLVLVDPAR